MSGIADVLDEMEPPPMPPEGTRTRARSTPAPVGTKQRKSKAKKTQEFDQDGAPLFSDIALASAFAREAALDFRWSPGLGWMVYDGTIWKRDDKLQRYAPAREVCVRFSSLAEDAGEARRLASAKTVQATLTLAQADAGIVLPAEIWDRDPLAMNTPGGIVDLTTGIRRFPRNTDYVTQATRVTPDPDAACPTWHRFLDSVFEGDSDMMEFMRRALGYCMTGDRREQILLFWYGLGANGKSVLAELVQWIAGTYTLKLPSEVLMQAKGERHPTGVAQLRGKRLAISSELDENCFFNESLIKELTGDDTLTARFMRGDFFEFAMTQKHVVIGNHKPRLRGGDPAIARRMVLVPFNASFKGDARDPLMLAKLKAEAPAILHWIVQGAIEWHRDGLRIPEMVRAASAEYMGDHDDLALWLEECCKREGEAKASDLYGSFSRWKKARGEHAPSMTVWGSRLTSLSGVGKRRANGVRYSGIRLTLEEMEALRVSAF